MPIYIDTEKMLLRCEGRMFDPWGLCWIDDASVSVDKGAGDLRPVSAEDAMRWLFETQKVRQVPVAVIGAKDASDQECTDAEALGAALANVGYTLLTGGRTGVMEAASRGAYQAGGLVLGLLPGDEFDTANSYVSVPLATGIGPTRNSVIARSARVLVAVGGGYGTITEMAYGLHYNRPVFALPSAPEVPDIVRCKDVPAVMAGIACAFLGILDRDDA
ncbi:TIGR00725 family protein [Thalassospira alkalitolerans]|uniref:TIGR00725 family protein n=1 Tax=Thalassospira alkalitolerans TaxID=1293890 RepID=UPI003AA7C5C5